MNGLQRSPSGSWTKIISLFGYMKLKNATNLCGYCGRFVRLFFFTIRMVQGEAPTKKRAKKQRHKTPSQTDYCKKWNISYLFCISRLLCLFRKHVSRKWNANCGSTALELYRQSQSKSGEGNATPVLTTARTCLLRMQMHMFFFFKYSRSHPSATWKRDCTSWQSGVEVSGGSCTCC